LGSHGFVTVLTKAYSRSPAVWYVLFTSFRTFIGGYAMLLWLTEFKGSVRFEVFTAVTMKNGVFWDVTPYGSCKNRRFEGT
jgi:hypothetical protein